MNNLDSGAITREDVFIKLGEPDIIAADGNCITYTWEMVKAVWILVGYGGAASGSIDRVYDLVLCFDDQGLLNRKELKKKTKFE